MVPCVFQSEGLTALSPGQRPGKGAVFCLFALKGPNNLLALVVRALSGLGIVFLRGPRALPSSLRTNLVGLGGLGLMGESPSE